MTQTTQSTWTLRCEGSALVLTDGRHREVWDVTRPWTARDMREALHAATGNGLAAGAKAGAAPAPSCDAPNCGCATGEDCAANGAARRVPDAARVARDLAAKLRARHVPLWTLSWQGDRFQIEDGVVTATTGVLGRDATVQESVVAINGLVRGMRLTLAEMGDIVGIQNNDDGTSEPIYGQPPFDLSADALDVMAPGMRVQTTPTFRRVGDDIVVNDGHGNETVVDGRLKPEDRLFVDAPKLAPGAKIDTNAPPAPDLAARLDGLKASVDALAERLERGPATGTKYDPVLIGTPRVTVSYPFRQEEWTCRADLRRVGPGRYVRDQKGRVAQVASMMHDTDGTSRPTVDVIDEKG